MIKKISALGLISWIMVFVLTAQPVRIKINEDIFLIHLQDSVYIHETWDSAPGFGRFSSNGMIIISRGKALMIDTPMDNGKTEILTSWLKDQWSVEVDRLVIGHFHNDCLGGLEYLQSLGVESFACNLTIDKCRQLSLPVPSTGFEKTIEFNFNGLEVVCNFPGAGHSFDNITVWLPQKKILFGGCLVKSMESSNLGNLSDAVVNDWDDTILFLINTYKDINIVVPGHGSYGGAELLDHTLTLLSNQ